MFRKKNWDTTTKKAQKVIANWLVVAYVHGSEEVCINNNLSSIIIIYYNLGMYSKL